MRNADGAGQVNSMSTEIPSWVGVQQGWSKLDQIENWLRSPAGYRAGYWRVQGELLLGEGRLDFARAEATPLAAGSSRNMPPSWLVRLGAAQEGFRRVLSAPARDGTQERRARQGLDEITRIKNSQGSATSTSQIAQLTRASWQAKSANPAKLTVTGAGYHRITIHHTADVPGTRFDGSLADSINVIQKVQRTHMVQNGWGDIGYHYLIDAKGRVLEGRNIRYQGAHAGKRANVNNNVGNIGVCLIGHFQWSSPSAEAMSSLNNLLITLRQTHGIQRGAVSSHGELKATECPGPALAKWTTRYRRTGPLLAAGQTYAAPAAQPLMTRKRSQLGRRSSRSAGNSSAIR